MRAHIIEIELVLGQLDDVIADLLVSRERLGCQSLDVFNGVLPAQWGLWWCQGCHLGVHRQLESPSRCCVLMLRRWRGVEPGHRA